MADLYLIDGPFGRNGLAIAVGDKKAIVVLLQDGVHLGLDELPGPGLRLYALAADVIQRGLADRLPAGVELIDVGRLVDLIVTNKVVNFA